MPEAHAESGGRRRTARLDLRGPGAARGRAAGAVRFGRLLQRRLALGETSAYAAALTYNFLFALFPLALALAAVLPALRLGEGGQNLGAALTAVVPPEVVRLVGTTRASGRGHGAVAVAGAGGYVLGMSAAFRRLMEAFRRARAARRRGRPQRGRRALWWTVTLSVVLAMTLGLGLIVAMVLMTAGQAIVRAALPAPGSGAAAAAIEVVRWLVLAAVALAMVAVLYWVGPEGRRPFRVASPGAVAAIAVWAAISSGFSVYLSRFNAYNALYGSMGAVILLLLYLYFLSYALLLGAEIDALLSRRAAVRAGGRTPRRAPPGAAR